MNRVSASHHERQLEVAGRGFPDPSGQRRRLSGRAVGPLTQVLRATGQDGLFVRTECQAIWQPVRATPASLFSGGRVVDHDFVR